MASKEVALWRRRTLIFTQFLAFDVTMLVYILPFRDPSLFHRERIIVLIIALFLGNSMMALNYYESVIQLFRSHNYISYRYDSEKDEVRATVGISVCFYLGSLLVLLAQLDSGIDLSIFGQLFSWKFFYMVAGIAYLNLNVFLLLSATHILNPEFFKGGSIHAPSRLARSAMIGLNCIFSGLLFWSLCSLTIAIMGGVIELEDYRVAHSRWVGVGPRADIEGLMFGFVFPVMLIIGIIFLCFVIPYKINKHLSGN